MKMIWLEFLWVFGVVCVLEEGGCLGGLFFCGEVYRLVYY